MIERLSAKDYKSSITDLLREQGQPRSRVSTDNGAEPEDHREQGHIFDAPPTHQSFETADEEAIRDDHPPMSSMRRAVQASVAVKGVDLVVSSLLAKYAMDDNVREYKATEEEKEILVDAYEPLMEQYGNFVDPRLYALMVTGIVYMPKYTVASLRRDMMKMQQDMEELKKNMRG